MYRESVIGASRFSLYDFEIIVITFLNMNGNSIIFFDATNSKFRIQSEELYIIIRETFWLKIIFYLLFSSIYYSITFDSIGFYSIIFDSF